MIDQADPLTKFLAVLEVGTRTRPGPDGMLSPEAKLAMHLIAGLDPAEGGFSLDETNYLDDEVEESVCEERISSEPPGPGWLYCGNFRWIRLQNTGLVENEH